MDEASWGEAFPGRPHDVGFEGAVVIGFDAPDEIKSINTLSRMHHHPRHAYQQRWKAAALDPCLPLADELVRFRGYRVEVQAVLPMRPHAQRDLANYGWAADPLKYTLDGIVASQLVLPDDNARWVEPGRVWFDNDAESQVRVRVFCAAPVDAVMPF